MCSRNSATTAWPPSWKAVSRLALSLMTLLFFSGPIWTFLMASSISYEVMNLLPFDTAMSAASLSKFSRSAPEKPGVPLAIEFKSTSSPSGLPLACTRRMASRPLMSGRPIYTLLSKRPGLVRALSSISSRFVAAMTMTPSLFVKPSISTSSWFRVCSLSSWPPPRPEPLCRPTASISSMNMMAGATFFAWSNKSLTLDAPTPT